MKVHNPGPGTYREKSDVSFDGRYLMSNDKNSCTPTMKLPLKRKQYDRISGNNFTRDVPGPGSYSPCDTKSTNKYRNDYDYKLHTVNRKIELHDTTKKDLPGPGQYLLPSDFGNVSQLSSNGGGNRLLK